MKYLSKETPTLTKEKDSYKVKETGDELSFLEIKNTKSKFNNKNEGVNADISTTCINIVDNFNRLDKSITNKEIVSHRISKYNNSHPCKEYKYAIVDKKIIKLKLNKSLEDTLNIIKCRKIPIDTYTTPCKDRKNRCYKLNINYSKYNCSEELHSSRLSRRDKSPLNDSSKLKLSNSQIINLKNSFNTSQKGNSIKPGENKSKSSKFKTPMNNKSKIKVKIEYNKYNKSNSSVTKK